MSRSAVLSLVVMGFSLLAACAPVSGPTDVAPTSSPAATAVSPPAPTATPTATPTPFPTPAPTIAPGAVASIVAAGVDRLAAEGAEPLCLRWEDTDGDGDAEWVGLHWRPGEPAMLSAFVVDGDRWHDLAPLETEKHGLGEYPTCELDVRDVNADGRIEILVWGHAGTSTDILHVFVWDETSYALLALFEGEAGVRVRNEDGDLADEVSVGYEAGDDLVWEAVHTWDGVAYGWTWERYDWFYLDRPHAYRTDSPLRAVISFYLAVDDRDLPGAYALLSPETQAARPAEEWMAGYATTVAVEVGSVHELSRSGGTATVIAQVRAYDNEEGRVVGSLWDVEWAVQRTSAGWRLESATTNQLERWEAVYYP